jgi:ATP-binding cassette subfamily B protein
LRAHAAPGRHPPEILKDVRASFPPRSFTALLGQSGSGKTTLLNILSGRGSGTFRGTLLLNGRDIKYKALKHFANLVPQDGAKREA